MGHADPGDRSARVVVRHPHRAVGGSELPAGEQVPVRRANFVGLQNYSELFADDAFRRSLGITATFVLFVVPAQTVLAILVAATLQGVARGRTLFRTVFFVPYMTSTVAITTIFMQLFVKGGPVSSTLARFGTPDVTWYADTGMASSSWSSCTSTCSSASTS